MSMPSSRVFVAIMARRRPVLNAPSKRSLSSLLIDPWWTTFWIFSWVSSVLSLSAVCLEFVKISVFIPVFVSSPIVLAPARKGFFISSSVSGIASFSLNSCGLFSSAMSISRGLSDPFRSLAIFLGFPTVADSPILWRLCLVRCFSRSRSTKSW